MAPTPSSQGNQGLNTSISASMMKHIDRLEAVADLPGGHFSGRSPLLIARTPTLSSPGCAKLRPVASWGQTKRWNPLRQSEKEEL